jgi:hypothetical protein
MWRACCASFSESDKLYKVRDEEGRPLRSPRCDGDGGRPGARTAASFDAERAVRKHIGDYALFLSGMYPESMDAVSQTAGPA